MPELDELVAAMRSAADGLPAAPLMPGVRARAGSLQRRRMVAAAAVAVVAVGTVLGVGYLALDQSARPLPAGVAKPDFSPSDLVGPTWTLRSWTTTRGTVAKPTTDRPPTLVFTNQTTAQTDDAANTTSWTVRLRKGTVFGVQGPTTQVAAGPPSRAVLAAVSSVLAGSSSWQITGDTLVIRRGSGQSLVYSRSPVPTGKASASPLAVKDVSSLVGPTWWLTRVSRYGRTWAPMGSRPASLRFLTTSSAETDDGSNTKEWTLASSAGVIRWIGGEETLASEDASGFLVSSTVDGVFTRPTTWQQAGSRLVFRTADGGTLTYSKVAPPKQPEPTGIAVFLDVNPPGGKIARGQALHLTAGNVTVVNAAGAVALRVRVTADDNGESRLPAGTYTVKATIPGGSCAPTPATIARGQVSEVDLVCTRKPPVG